MGSSGTALGIIGIILSAGAIGFAFIVWNGQNTTNSDLDDLTDDFNNMTRTIVVGIWETLDDNLDYAPYDSSDDWLFEFGDNTLNNTDYISTSNDNTRITLLTSGWYRIHLSVLLTGISPSSYYWIGLLKDDVLVFNHDRLQTTAGETDYWHYVDSFAFVYSDGTNYIEINAYSSGDISFHSNADDAFNQLTIEYVAI